jgi:hypothetical protein
MKRELIAVISLFVVATLVLAATAWASRNRTAAQRRYSPSTHLPNIPNEFRDEYQ